MQLRTTYILKKNGLLEQQQENPEKSIIFFLYVALSNEQQQIWNDVAQLITWIINNFKNKKRRNKIHLNFSMHLKINYLDKIWNFFYRNI